jgi:phage terminase large subunit-like protein
MKPERQLAAGTDPVQLLKSFDPARRRAGLELLGEEEREALDRAWEAWAHAGQLAPAGDWSTWVIKAGRGFGKTLAGAQWVTARIAEGQALRIALVGATLEDARRVMVEGRSGLLEVAGAWVTDWHPSLNRLRFRTGAEAVLFSGATPHLLRGPEHHYAWCDELAKWDKGQESWDMLQLGLRLGARPRALVTTTPRPGPVLKAIMDDPATVVTGGPTAANPHLPRAWHERVQRLYAGTRLGRQELDGELLPDAAGALWTVELIERCRVRSIPPSRERAGERGTNAPPDSPSPSLSPEGERGRYARTLIAVDPPSGDGTCGIIACAREGEGIAAVAHVLADHSVTGRSPEGWAAAVAAAAAAHGTSEVVAEANQGGKMVKAVLHAADPGLRVRLVNAHTGKTARAEPVAHLCEAGRVRLHGRMPELEAQLLGMIAGGGYEGPGQSPDRADAMVWGVSELMRERGVVRVRVV